MKTYKVARAGFVLAWRGDFFALGFLIDGRRYWQGLHLDIRGMGTEQRTEMRLALAALVRSIRAGGERLDIRSYRYFSGSRRRGKR